MSLRSDGKTAMAAMLENAAIFPRIKSEDWTSSSVRLAKKQVIAGGLTVDDVRTIRELLGRDIFDRTLSDLSAYHTKLLAKRLSPGIEDQTVASKSMALGVIHTALDAAADSEDTTELADAPAPSAQDRADEALEPAASPRPNPYIGRKAFRVR